MIALKYDYVHPEWRLLSLVVVYLFVVINDDGKKLTEMKGVNKIVDVFLFLDIFRLLTWTYSICSAFYINTSIGAL